MARSVGKSRLVYLGARVPEEMKKELEAIARKESVTVTDTVIRAIRKGLAV